MIMKDTVSLPQYVKRRNGVPLGAAGSLRNMLARSFGARSFPVFWQYWNPIWGYYLSRNVMRPLSAILPAPLAIFATFLVSGALHDVAVFLVKWKVIVFFTPWFGLMGLLVILSGKMGISYGNFVWPIRSLINTSLIGGSLGLTYYAVALYA